MCRATGILFFLLATVRHIVTILNPQLSLIPWHWCCLVGVKTLPQPIDALTLVYAFIHWYHLMISFLICMIIPIAFVYSLCNEYSSCPLHLHYTMHMIRLLIRLEKAKILEKYSVHIFMFFVIIKNKEIVRTMLV